MRHLLTTLTNWWGEDPRGPAAKQLITTLETTKQTLLEQSQTDPWLIERGLSLTEAQFKDISAIMQLESAGYDGYLAWRRPDFQYDLRSNPYQMYLLVWHDQELVAMISGRALAKRTHISHLIVTPTWQNQQLGSYLLQLWLDWSMQLNLPQVTLEMKASNQRLLEFYRRHGFQLNYVMENYYDQKNDALSLRWQA